MTIMIVSMVAMIDVALVVMIAIMMMVVVVVMIMVVVVTTNVSMSNAKNVFFKIKNQIHNLFSWF